MPERYFAVCAYKEGFGNAIDAIANGSVTPRVYDHRPITAEILDESLAILRGILE